MAKQLKAEVLSGPAIVYPVEGAFLAGVPARPTSTTDEVARRLVATGAFRYDAPALPDPDPETGLTEAPLIEVFPLPEEALAALGFYHNLED